jgi:hypothetical protein
MVVRRWNRAWALGVAIPVAVALLFWIFDSVSTTSLLVIAVVLVAFECWAYLDGPASFVAITDRRVEVGNMFRRYSVPRSQVEEFSAGEIWLDLNVKDHKPIRVRAATPPLSPGQSGSGRRYVVQAKRLNDALAATRAASVAGSVESRVRPVSVLVALLPFVLLALLLTLR